MSFLVHAQQKALILNVADPGHVLTNVPRSKKIEFQGKSLVVVPHDIAGAQALRKLGYMVPSPIGFHYDWPRDKMQVPAPFTNQLETAAFLTLNDRAFCLNQIGTGKSLAAAWAADYLISAGLIRKTLIISPLSTLERVWGDAMFIHLQHRSLAVLHGSAEKRKKLFRNDKHDFYVINPDGLDIITELVFKEKKVRKDPMDQSETPAVTKQLVGANFLRNDIDLVIIDEIGMYRNHGTNRFRILNRAIKPEMRVWGLTGTPTPNEPADAWAQCRLVTPWTVPSYFVMFKQQTMQQLTEYIWVPRKEANEIVYQVMQPSIRFTRDECFDLPECTYSHREVELSAEQKKHYKEIASDLVTQIHGGMVTAMNEGVKAGKLVQIACGVVYDKNGVEREIDAKARIAAVKEIIESAGHKVIVFVPFTAPLKMLKRELSKSFTCEIVYGGVAAKERAQIFADFQSKPDPRLLIADAGAMSHGLTLTEANTIVWYGPEWSNDTYTQANGRITRPGQKNAQHIIHIASTEIERRIYNRLQERGKVQNVLLEMVQKGVALI